MEGWECPKCGIVYAPWKDRRDCAGLDKYKPQQYFQPQNKQEKCLACYDYHPQGMACPEWKVTSK